MLCVILTGLCLHGKESGRHRSLIGIDISSAIRNCCAAVTVSHGFADRWSVSGQADIYLKERILNTDETIHYGEISGGTATAGARHRSFTGGISVEYWTGQCYKGTFFGFGGRYGPDDGFDCTVEIGYAFRIWRCLSAQVSFEMGLISSYTNRTIDGKGTGIGLNIIF